MKTIKPFLDEDGRVKQLPAKSGLRQEILRYLSGKFKADVRYTEKEVNRILTDWSTIDDYFTLRRGLIDLALLMRTPDGSQYWLNPSLEHEEHEGDEG